MLERGISKSKRGTYTQQSDRKEIQILLYTVDSSDGAVQSIQRVIKFLM